jgi:hypothetical protein
MHKVKVLSKDEAIAKVPGILKDVLESLVQSDVLQKSESEIIEYLNTASDNLAVVMNVHDAFSDSNGRHNCFYEFSKRLAVAAFGVLVRLDREGNDD